MIVKELGNLRQMVVSHSVNILPQLSQSKLGLRFAVRMVKASYPRTFSTDLINVTWKDWA
jgi:hypothetical protein